MTRLRIGTRGSQLALWQARAVAAAIEESGGPSSEIIVITTSGDRISQAPLAQVGGKRLFVKEIEDALLDDRIDLAVHSAKDMPAALPDGLAIGAVLPREDPRDAIVLGAGHPSAATDLDALVAALPPDPRIATGSVRRVAQLKRLLPRATFEPIRGNLDTRLRRLARGDADALALAVAGLRRLGVSDRISVILPVDACVPAPGQGIVAIEVRVEDARSRTPLDPITHVATAAALEAERAAVAALGGGCQVPLGAVALPIGQELELYAVVVSLDGTRAVRARARMRADDPARLGAEVARRLIEDGAREILDDVHRAMAPVEGIQP